MTVTEDAVDRVQRKLGAALHANRPGSGIDHVLIVLPSYSVSESILSHYGDRIASLEHRYLNAVLVADRIPECDVVFISTKRPSDVAIEALVDLIPPERRASARERFRLIEVDDGTPRSVAAKLLDRPDELDALRRLIGDRPALIEPWNVTEAEIALALALDVPINGTRPELRPLGFKSEGRRLLARAGVPVPLGREDVHSIDDVVAAAIAIRSERPEAPGIIVKHDDSGAGDGNAVLALPEPGAPSSEVADRVRAEASELPAWYLDDLARGGIVEERIAGAEFASPSAQVDIRPDGSVVVLATHEQVLGGPDGQIFLGCRFPAEPAYAAELGRHAAAIGRELAGRGVLGRFSVDFVAVRDPGAAWRVYGLEINLRKGGTTHPYAALRSVVPGRYDAEAGRWIADDGSTRCYAATDNAVDPSWTGLPPEALVRAVADRGLEFDPARRTGVVLHMLSGLAIDGRFGMTAIAETPAAAAQLEADVRAVAAATADRVLARS